MIPMLLGAVLAAPPNVVVVLTDDQGYGDLSAHGNPVLRTPHLDRLHAAAARLTDFHVSPTCSPTRAALLTGRHEFRSGVTHTILERERLAPRAVTLADILSKAGYATGIFGKWHLGDEPAYWPTRRGFGEAFVHGGGGIGQTYPGSCGDAPGNTYFDPWVLHNGRFEKTQGYCTDVFFGQALKWVEGVKGKPFFCLITPNAPHAPLQVRPADEARYAGKGLPADTAKFFGMVANIDDNVGRLLDKLDEWKLSENTLVVFLTDNGGTVGVPVFNAGMRGRKGTPWLGGTRACSLWRLPGRFPPGDRPQLAAHLDVLPTLAALCGATPPAGVEGRSLLPTLADPTAAWADRTLFTHLGRWPKGAPVEEYKFADCSVRTCRWHLVSPGQAKGKRWQLYDLPADPGERTDVASTHPKVVAKLDGEYAAWWASVQPGLVNEAAIGPAENPFKALHREQTGGR